MQFLWYVFHAFMQAMWQVGGCGNSQTCQTACTNEWKAYLKQLCLKYSIPYDEYKMFETCRRQEELNENINLKSAFCWLTLHKREILCPCQ
jgi:hypothetical protein